VNDLELHSALLCPVLELKHAAGISRRQNVNIGFLDFVHLSIQYFHRKLILRDVINSRAAAALIGTLDFYKLYAWNRF
jgi:hypothetical protein